MAPQAYDFANFRVDAGERALLHDGRPVPVSLPYVSADAGAYAYTYWTTSSQLFVVEGAR